MLGLKLFSGTICCHRMVLHTLVVITLVVFTLEFISPQQRATRVRIRTGYPVRAWFRDPLVHNHGLTSVHAGLHPKVPYDDASYALLPIDPELVAPCNSYCLDIRSVLSYRIPATYPCHIVSLKEVFWTPA
jgi:hypothetical protein